MRHSSEKGIVFNIQQFSVHDGSGIRTIVFIKGCPLRCSWCSNPESQNFSQELGYNPENCLGCCTCIRHCKSGVMSAKNGVIHFNPEKYEYEDLNLATICPSEALKIYGKKYTAEEVIDLVEKDNAFFSRSNGGLTLSGGEPMASPEFSLALVQEAKRRHMNIAMESCGYAPAETAIALTSYMNEVFFDIKIMNTDRHKKATGRDNTTILRTIKEVRKAHPSLKLTIRTPVVPGVNDNEEDISAIAHFVRDELGKGVSYELMRFHRFGESKYKNLGRNYLFSGKELSKDKYESLKEIANHILKIQ